LSAGIRGYGANVKCARPGAEDFEAGFFCLGGRSEFERKFLVLAGERRNGDSLRVGGARPPRQTNSDFRSCIAGQNHSAFVRFVSTDTQPGLANAVRLGPIELHPRAMPADEGPLGIHFERSLRPNRLKRLAKEASKKGIRRRRCGGAGNCVGEFSVSQNFGPLFTM
jgi:hypothetical protein